ncbi:MAG: sugar phosphate isomerase/epimerase [Firmicutes bacterium]|nr:sugar phosphate isomerase/epimerase [Bacillota bacterium]
MVGKIPVALQMFSVRHELGQDFKGTLKAVKDAGYTGVEFFGMPMHPAGEIRTMLEELDLACAGWHVPFELVQADKLDETIAFHKELGNEYLIIPGIPEEFRKTRADWLKLAQFFNELSDKLAEHGMLTGYHNHAVEFQELDGELPWDTFFQNTKKPVIMQLDLGNAMVGGVEVLPILEKYRGRATTIHLKPYSFAAGKDDPRAGYRPVIGEDDVPWHEVFEICEADGTEWYIVEYESDAYPPLEAVRKCLWAIKQLQAAR